MLRCFYGRLVKCALGEPGSSISFKVSDPSSSRQFIINLRARHLNGMTFTEKKFSTASRDGSPEAEKSNSSLRNGIVLRNSSLTEGHYRNQHQQQYGHSNQQSSQTNDEKGNRESNKCEFNVNSINVRLLETFGFIVSVSISCFYNHVILARDTK